MPDLHLNGGSFGTLSGECATIRNPVACCFCLETIKFTLLHLSPDIILSRRRIDDIEEQWPSPSNIPEQNEVGPRVDYLNVMRRSGQGTDVDNGTHRRRGALGGGVAYNTTSAITNPTPHPRSIIGVVWVSPASVSCLSNIKLVKYSRGNLFPIRIENVL
ncbi:hypothetical protein WA026_003210 [Henosepilachna vigintioctopunctata]|uniref:Uncharacterized protein n=1 Tax=Henosepilachna vigintioctopunctata TaxID=420089 RepID=A0AAW1TH93_9CUCU